ncbi:YjbF family lipoprotein [Marivita geojedonensis]|nr:YjbF family lipoprotein [Marivita geojedonensis]
MMWRSFISLVVATILGACSQLTSLAGLGGSEVVIGTATRDSLQVSVPVLGAQGFATEAARIGSVVTWRTADNATFSFDQGVIVSTRGLGDDLMGADATQSIAAVNGGALAWAPRINGYMNGEYQSFFMTFQCRRSDTQSVQTPVGNRLVTATRITEACINDERQIENTYWRNSNGLVLKSRQWVSPGVGYVETERVIR